MSDKYDKLDMVNQFVEEVNEELEAFHISQYFYTKRHFGFFVTRKGRVYGFGENCLGQLGLGHNYPVTRFTVIPELFGQNICEFFVGNSCVFAKNRKNEIYCWGGNNWAQLGIGLKNDLDTFFKPTKMNFPGNKLINQVSCGDYHNLALSTDGLVYGWGGNLYGQTGSGKSETPVILPELVAIWKNQLGKHKHHEKPQFKSAALPISGTLSSLSRSKYHDLSSLNIGGASSSVLSSIAGDFYVQDDIISVKAFGNCSFAITKSEQVYFWGEDMWGLLDKSGETISLAMLLDKIQANKIECTDEQMFFKKENRIFQFKDNSIVDLSKVNDFTIIDSEKLIYESEGRVYEWSDHAQTKTVFKNICEYFLIKFQTTFKTIRLEKGYDFQKIRQKNHDKTHLITVILNLDKDIVVSDLKKIRQLSSAFVAQVRDYKIEDNTLSIKTDFFDQTLEDVIEVKAKAFQRRHNEDMNSIEFFFSINLLRELTECLNYLHSLSPPVVHRELRPLTVLITDGRNNRFIKLCDIGLGQIADDKDYYSVSGSCDSGYNSYQSQSKRGRSSENFLDYRLRYQAPEVIRGNYYNHKADIYSLAMIAMDLFELESCENWQNSDQSLTRMKIMDKLFSRLKDTLSKCIYPAEFYKRPDSVALLNETKRLVFSPNVVINEKDFKQTKDCLEKFENQFFNRYLTSKLHPFY